MSERDAFTGGFLAGAVMGSLLGGVIGALVAARRDEEEGTKEGSLLNTGLSTSRPLKGKRGQIQTEESIEGSRRSLEDKIAQLNMAIDDVRQQLGNVNGNSEARNRERSLDS
ncbi:hypothetical protein [Lyngbya aestuarii]|uniref:hypothetical protein n=1 Tax=Lyngbya aestuarii TaxID=118322 RepID=UPI00403D6975